MKNSKNNTHRKYSCFPVLAFEQQRLTSFSGLVLFQKLFDNLNLKSRLRECFRHLKFHPIFGHASIILLLVVHLLLGYRRIRDLKYYDNDPLVKRLLGLTRLPDVATVSRSLMQADAQSVEKLQALSAALVMDRLAQLPSSRLTLDFDGSVLSTKRHAENTAVGFNKKHKGRRSYYPLFCTVAQTGQVLDFLHRPGNVHDSNGAIDFVQNCYSSIWTHCHPEKAHIESRFDSAFFSDAMVGTLLEWGVDFSMSVPFERFVELKSMVEARRHWRYIDADIAYFETAWKPKSWAQDFRFLFIRTRNQRQNKEPIQLDLFVPKEYGYDYKVILTNKKASAKSVLRFHNGRGSQEGVFAELKDQAAMDYIPFKRLIPNQIYLTAAVMAHNLSRELQMATQAHHRNINSRRSPIWIFQHINTVRRNLINRAGRFTNPKGRLTLTISANHNVRQEIVSFVQKLRKAA